MKFRLAALALVAGLSAVTPAQAYSVSFPTDGQNLGALDLGLNTVKDRMVGRCGGFGGCSGSVTTFITELPSDLRLTSASVSITYFSAANRMAIFSTDSLVGVTAMLFGADTTGNMLPNPVSGPGAITWQSQFRQTIATDGIFELDYTWSFTTEKIGTATPVPLPATLPLLVTALAGLAALRRGRSSRG